MLRRVARVLRISLLLAGISLLVWLPASFIFVALLDLPPAMGVTAFSEGGALYIWCLDELDHALSPSGFDIRVHKRASLYDDAPSESDAVLPSITYPVPGFRDTVIAIPLWLLAFLCLAWPVTSFIIARKRKGRGFEVEPAGTSNIQHPTSNIEAP